MHKSVLVVAAHSDDEALGCGGVIAKHSMQGHKVDIVFMTDGVSSRSGVGVIDKLSRSRAAQNACSILRINQMHTFSFPDNELDKASLLDIVKAVESIVEMVKPDIVYTHHHGDLNIDHQLTHQAVMTACRPMPGGTVKELFGFEVLSSTEWNTPAGHLAFLPNCFIDISDQMALKIKALEAYSDEMREIPHSRTIEHCKILAAHRGYTIGVHAAEAFVTYRLIR